MLKKLSFKLKLLILSAILSFFTILVSVFSYQELHLVEKKYDYIIDVTVPNIISVNKLYLEYKDLRINLRSLGLENITENETKGY